MTVQEILDFVGRQLGDNTTGFENPILLGILNQVLAEMAARDCIRSLRRTSTFSFVAGQRDYATQTITGLSGVNYPIDMIRLVVPAWGSAIGFLQRKSEDVFELALLNSTDSSGNPRRARPRIWRLYPNEQTLQVDPVPSSADIITNGVRATWLAPPTVLLVSDTITEIRQEFLPVILSGMIKWGAVFQDETLQDRDRAFRDFEIGMTRMRGQTQRERGRVVRGTYRDF